MWGEEAEELVALRTSPQRIPVWIGGEDLEPPYHNHNTAGPNLSLYKEVSPFHLSKSDLYKKPVPTQGKVPRTEINLLYKKVARLTWLT